MLGNDLPEGPWCGHPHVDLRTWQCPDCGRLLPEAAKVRLQSAFREAPSGYVWVLIHGYQDECVGGFAALPGAVVGIFTNPRRILHRLVRGYITSANDIRARKIHWYQCVRNSDIFEGWDEGDVKRPECYELSLTKLNSCG